jgi:two-component system, NarL family, nitrate/nitrite response regulator NarL
VIEAEGSIEWQATATDAGGSVDGAVDRRVQVLVADDNKEVLMATGDLIQDFPGVGVVSLTTSVDEAVRSAASHRPDVAFIDAFLRGGGAEAAAVRIKSVSPDTIVVALTSAKDLELVLRLRAVGVAGCYEKETLSAVLPEILASLSLHL